MADTRINSIVILGGGTAGWMTAAALAKRFNNQPKITLVESSSIGTIGVGEATVPAIKDFLSLLKIDEVEFMRATNATYKLGIQFENWHKPATHFLHPFAGYGARIDNIPFYHCWIKMRQQGQAQPLDNYCLAAQMAQTHKFALPKANPEAELAAFNYAFHFDAGLFAQYLAQYAQALGVMRIDAQLTGAIQDPSTGFITALQLSDGQTLQGDLFIDCSGFKGLLIEDLLKTGYENWSHWLPCDSAVAVATHATDTPAPYTRAIASSAGWQWRIPLQNRQGNGHVYASAYLDKEQAATQLLNTLEGDPLAEPKHLQFVTGMRTQTWNKNVYAIGLASGFLEPLESTSIYMIHESINQLIDHFPNRQWNPALNQQVNKILRLRQEKLRDFIILHYHLNERKGEAFWDACRNMAIPTSLSEQIHLFQTSAQVNLDNLDFFRTNSWLAMFAGFQRLPDYYHPATDQFNEQQLAAELDAIAASIQQALPQLPSHQQFLSANIFNSSMER
jgi:tryptophan 7-halogenase